MSQQKLQNPTKYTALICMLLSQELIYHTRFSIILKFAGADVSNIPEKYLTARRRCT